jgi:hypothetical protein
MSHKNPVGTERKTTSRKGTGQFAILIGLNPICCNRHQRAVAGTITGVVCRIRILTITRQPVSEIVAKPATTNQEPRPSV